MTDFSNPDNPLTIYKKSEEISWAEIGIRTGLYFRTLANISRKDESQISTVPIGSYNKIKDSIGVDLLNWK